MGRTRSLWDKFTILFRHQIWRVGKVWPAASSGVSSAAKYTYRCAYLYTRGTREATGIIRYLIWVSRRYISLGVDGTACSLDFRFCTRVDPWFTVISIKDPLERVPIIPPSPLSSSPILLPTALVSPMQSLFFFASTFVPTMSRAYFYIPRRRLPTIHRHEARKRKKWKREREREWETLYRRPVEFSIFLKAP